MTCSRRELFALALRGAFAGGAVSLGLGGVGRRLARAEARAPLGGSVVGSLLSAPTTLDPTAALSWSDVSLTGLVFDTLYRVDPTGRIVPHLAAALPEPDAERTVRIPMLAGVRAHDGAELGAADAAASLARAAKALLWSWALAPVSEIRAEGSSLRLGLRRAAPDLALLLTTPGTAITRAGKVGAAKAAIGSGAFSVARQTSGRIELSAFSDCFAGRPFLDAVSLRWFERTDEEARSYEVGDADVSLRGAVAFAGHKPKNLTSEVQGAATVLAFLGFGRAHAAIDTDVGFRNVLSLALSRSALRHLGGGERVVPAISAESPDLGGAIPSAAATAARLDEARAALADATRRQAELAGTGLVLQVIVDRTRLDDAELAGRVVAALDAVGLRSRYDALAPADFARRVDAGQCDVWIGQLVAPSPEPAHELALAFAVGGDPWAAQRLATAPLDAATARAELAKRWPIVPLYHRAVRAHHRTSLRGLAFDTQSRVGWPDMFNFKAR